MNAAVTLTASALGRRIIQQPGEFVRLVLLEAARFGMPGNLVATLDELASSIGLYESLPLPQSTFVAAPIVSWRSSPHMPTQERTPEIEALAYAQRAEVAFGVTKGVMVGPADIVCALNNCIMSAKDGIQELHVPPEWRRVYQWAAAKVRAELEGITPQEAARLLRFDFIPDDDVVKPRGPLYATYVQIAQNIRLDAVGIVAPQKTPKAFAARVSDDLLRDIARQLLELSPNGTTPDDKAEEVAHLNAVADSLINSIRAYRALLVAEEPVAS